MKESVSEKKCYIHLLKMKFLEWCIIMKVSFSLRYCFYFANSLLPAKKNPKYYQRLVESKKKITNNIHIIASAPQATIIWVICVYPDFGHSLIPIIQGKP